MKCVYVLDEGLPVPCQTGVGLDTVASLQSAIKYLVKSKEVQAATQDQIEVYPPGTTIHNFREQTPLKPEDKLPSQSTEKNYIFVHAPRDYQDLTPEERKLYANPKYDKTPKSPVKAQSPKVKKTIARPPATQLKISKPKSSTQKAEEEALRRKEEEEQLAARKSEEERLAKELAAIKLAKEKEDEAERARRLAAKKAAAEEEEEDGKTIAILLLQTMFGHYRVCTIKCISHFQSSRRHLRHRHHSEERESGAV